MAPGAFVWIVLTLAGMSMWCFAREWIGGPYAKLAAVLYAIGPYHLVIAYYRSAFGELLAAALLPLLIWAALGVIETGWRRVPTLALVFACVWLSNAPAGVIGTYSLGIILIAGCFLRLNVRPLLSGLCAMIGGFALAGFYVLPAAWEQRWVEIKQVVADTYRPSVNFLFARANEPDFVAFNWKVSWVGAGLILATGIAVRFTFKHRKKISRPWWILSALGLFSTALMLPPSVWLWRALPKLWFLQFPWRWLDVLGVAFAFFAAAAIAILPNRAAQWAIAIILFTAIITAGGTMLGEAPWDRSDVSQPTAWIQEGRGYEGTDEYAPIGCDRYQLPGDPDNSERPADVSPNPAPRIAALDSDSGHIIPATGVQLHVETWKSTYRLFTVEIPRPITLAPRLVSYPAWNIQVNGQIAKPELLPEREQILLPLLADRNRVQVRFGQTWDRTAGDAVSLLAAITLGLLAWRYRRRVLVNSG